MDGKNRNLSNKNKIKNIILLFFIVLAFGTIGYIILLKVSLIDALYMTVITVSTVGYKEVVAMSPNAKLFSIIVIFLGVGTVGYTFSTIVSMLVGGQFNEIWRFRMNEKKIATLKDHYIICGFDETSYVIIEQFTKEEIPFIVIDDDENSYYSLIDKGILVMLGSGTDSETLEKANIHSAKGLLSCLTNDVDNIVTVLTARNLNKDLFIISHAHDRESRKKIMQVGADNTISINEIGGRRMASLMIRPNVISFLDVITRFGDVEMELDEIVISNTSQLKGQSLLEAQIPKKTGLIILAIKKCNEENIIFNPNSQYVMEEGDSLIAMGSPDKLNKLKVLNE